MRLDLSGLPQCSQCRLKLVAVDGFQSVEDSFDDFHLDNQIPMAMIVIPVAQTVTIKEGQDLRLVGAAYDAESSAPDRALDPGSLTWTVSGTTESGTAISGMTIVGSPAFAKGLEAGNYIVELVAVDAGLARSPPAKLTVKVVSKPRP